MKKSKIYHLLVLFLSLFLLSGCSHKTQKPMILAANLWIGYAPLYYAYEKGWLRENNIKFVATISLSQSLKYFKKGSIDICAGTNYEFMKAKEVFSDVEAVKLLDISKGGDLILGNADIKKLKQSPKIDAYLEGNGISTLLLEKFIAKYRLNKNKIKFINQRLDVTANMNMRQIPTLAALYKPYDANLRKKGYKGHSKTAKSLKFLVYDVLFISKKRASNYKKDIRMLDILFQKALHALKNNPKEFYMTINPYFHYQNYGKFKKDLTSISFKSSKKLEDLVLAGNQK
ncbi:MAG: ABC transporter substrate-binding protein [Sulfurospirillum sp.]